MKYVRLSTENRVVEIIPEFNPAFPDVPITERYTKAFLAGLIEVADDVELAEGWVYDFTNGTFTEYVEPEPEPEPEPTPGDDSSVWDELDAAYQEGVDSV